MAVGKAELQRFVNEITSGGETKDAFAAGAEAQDASWYPKNPWREVQTQRWTEYIKRMGFFGLADPDAPV